MSYARYQHLLTEAKWQTMEQRRTERLAATGWHAYHVSDLALARAYRVLVQGASIETVAQQDQVCRETIYKMVRTVAELARQLGVVQRE